MKNRNSKKITTLFLSIFIILAGFLFFGTNSAYAAGGTCTYPEDIDLPPITIHVNSKAECDAKPKPNTYIEGATVTETKKANEAARQKKADEENCSLGEVANGSCLLVGILKFNGMLLGASAALFGVVVDADKLQKVIANPALYTVWMEVRDFLNIAFILFLLYSAFSIIFQIGGKFGEKKIILTIVLMALLVNFSFPIARFIVDISNSLMYTMLAQFFPGKPNDILTGITTGGGIGDILQTPAGAAYSQLFAAIFFTFLLAMTFLALAVLFLVRIVALAILIIISPIAFVGNIAGKDFGWWDNIIKYSFFGPIMVFVLHIAIFTMTAIGESFKLAQQDSVITSMANMAIPIVILWMGMGIAQKMGIEGASTVMGAAQKASTWLPRLVGKGAKYAAGAGLKKIDRDYIGARGFLKAWKDRTAEVDTAKVGTQAAKHRDRLGSIFDRGKRDSDYYKKVDKANRRATYKKEQDLFSTTDVDVIAGIDKLQGKTDSESTLRREAFFETLAGNKDLNEWGKHKNKEFNPISAKNSIYEELGGKKNEKSTIEALHHLEDLNQMNGVYSMCGLTEVLNETNIKGDDGKDRGVIGQRVLSNSTEQVNTAMGKMKQIDYQKMMIGLHANSIVNEDESGNGSGVHEFGMQALKFIESKGAKFAEDRWRGDTREKIYDGIINDEKSDEIRKQVPLLMKVLEKQFGEKNNTPTQAPTGPIGPLTMENPNIQ